MHPLEIGQALAQQYQITRFVADTAGVARFEATDTVNARRVWVKVMTAAATDIDAATRFEQDAARPTVIAVGKTDEGLPYLVEVDGAGEAGVDEPSVVVDAVEKRADRERRASRTIMIRAVRPRSTWRWLAGGVVVTALIVIAGWYVRHRPPHVSSTQPKQELPATVVPSTSPSSSAPVAIADTGSVSVAPPTSATASARPRGPRLSPRKRPPAP